MLVRSAIKWALPIFFTLLFVAKVYAQDYVTVERGMRIVDHGNNEGEVMTVYPKKGNFRVQFMIREKTISVARRVEKLMTPAMVAGIEVEEYNGISPNMMVEVDPYLGIPWSERPRSQERRQGMVTRVYSNGVIYTDNYKMTTRKEGQKTYRDRPYFLYFEFRGIPPFDILASCRRKLEEIRRSSSPSQMASPELVPQ